VLITLLIFKACDYFIS